VVRSAEYGEIDITPGNEQWTFRFLDHEGAEGEFLRMVANNGLPWVDHVIR
jgi:hypothetical protein